MPGQDSFLSGWIQPLLSTAVCGTSSRTASRKDAAAISLRCNRHVIISHASTPPYSNESQRDTSRLDGCQLVPVTDQYNKSLLTADNSIQGNERRRIRDIRHQSSTVCSEESVPKTAVVTVWLLLYIYDHAIDDHYCHCSNITHVRLPSVLISFIYPHFFEIGPGKVFSS